MSSTNNTSQTLIELDHVSIFASDYQLLYPPKAGAYCCTHGTGFQRCRRIRIIDHYMTNASNAERARVGQMLTRLLDRESNPFALGVDELFDLVEKLVENNLCKYHGGPSDVRKLWKEKLRELGWSNTEIETRSAAMRRDTEKSNPLRVGEGTYAIKGPEFGRHAIAATLKTGTSNGQEHSDVRHADDQLVVFQRWTDG